MCPGETNPARPRETRRQFIKKTGMAAAVVAGGSLLQLPVSARENNPAVSIVLDESDPVVTQAPVKWAVEQLHAALTGRGAAAQIYQNLDQASASQECVLVAGRNSNLSKHMLGDAGILLPDTPEAMALTRGQAGTRIILLAAGSDVR
ncbi:MAG: twin-arginine translocation signal domain-containing protein, partial [Verrucomicrobiota bacterium]